MQYLRSIPLLVLTSALAACTDGDQKMDITYDACQPIAVVPHDASDAEVASIATGLGLWNDIAGTELALSPVEGAQELPIRFESAAPMFYGIYRDETGDIVINHSLSDHMQRAITVAHEIGHALGLWHIDERDSVMRPANLTTPPNAQDAADVNALWGPCPVP